MIPAREVTVSRAPQVVKVEKHDTRTLCPDCAGLINDLAEELCSDCGVNGLTEKCLTCPGVIEVLGRLVKLAEAHPSIELGMYRGH